MENNNVIATYCLCNFGGIEILDVIDDRIVYRFNFGNAENKIHKAKIHYSDRDYFKTNYGMRVYLDECMRCN